MIEAYIGGASIRTIATDIGTSTGPVQRLISEAGIARRRGQHSGPRHPLWKGGISGYKGAHRRLRRLRGSAVGQPCVDCGMPATNWSFRGRTGYSKDVTDYDQRCDTCHAIFDGKAKLNPKLAREIRELWATGEWTIKELADEFGVCTKTVRKVLTGQSWKTAGGPLHQTGATVNRKLTEEKVRIIRRRAAARELQRVIAADDTGRASLAVGPRQLQTSCPAARGRGPLGSRHEEDCQHHREAN